MKKLKILAAAAAFGAAGVTGQAMAQQECFIGEVKMFGGNFAPRGYALMDGQLLSISSNTALFSILGTTYGGDGRTTFALPDLRSRSTVHPGTGSGLSTIRLGERGGRETVTLTTNEMPAHGHPATTTSALNASSAGGNSPDPTGKALANDGSDRIYRDDTPAVAMKDGAVTSTTTVANAGGNQPINNRSPFQGINHIICLQGTFPSRS
ncbi:MAG: tail fiber protein [Parvularculaceae bacterium]